MGQKDLAAKDLESRPEVFADIINALIYEGEQVVSAGQLQAAPTETLYESMVEEVDRKPVEETCRRLHSQYNDVSKYEMENQRIRIQYVLENESGENYRLILRKAGYEGAVYRSEYEEKHVYPVVILVLYWGDKEWKPHFDLYDLFKDSLKDATLRKYVDNIRLHIFPMAHLPEEVRKRFKSDIRIVVDYLAEGEAYEPTGQVINHIESVLRLLYALTGEKELPVMLADMQGKQEKGEEITMAGYYTTYYTTKCTQEGIQKGMQQGIQKGMQQGIQQGMERVSNLMRILLDSGRNEDIRRSVEDEEYREKLLREFNL